MRKKKKEEEKKSDLHRSESYAAHRPLSTFALASSARRAGRSFHPERASCTKHRCAPQPAADPSPAMWE